MPIPVVCPSCGNNISAPDHVAGRTLRCFKCLNPFVVPNVAPTPAPAAPMAQLAPSYSAPAPIAPPVAMPEPFSIPSAPEPMLAGLSAPEPMTAGPAASEAPAFEPAAPDPGNPFELAPPANGEAAAISPPLEELPSTQDLPMEDIQMEQAPTEEAPMELSPADEVEAPIEEAPVEEAPEEVSEEPVTPRKSRKVALLLCFLFGLLSIHRFYLGYTKSAIFQIILLPLGIGFIWVVFDFLRLLFGVGFKKDGRGVPLR